MPEQKISDLQDIDFADAIARRYTLANFLRGDFLRGELDMNAYERTVIKNYMNIEYGPGASIEQLTLAYGYFGSIVDKVKASGYDVPNDLQVAFNACDRDLRIKIKDQRLKEIQTLELRKDQLLSADEKRAKIDVELARLKELVK
jgi:hypothetical protein